MDLKGVIKRFEEKPHLMGYGAGKTGKLLKCSPSLIKEARRIVRKSLDTSSENRVLVIGDTHLPYEKEGYLEFCKEQYDKYKCNQVIHIGDLIDSHASSRHPSVPEAYGPGDELDYAIDKLKNWYKVFPEMKVCIGNHDAIANRQASSVMVSRKWLKDYNQVLEVPNWEFEESFEIDDTLYIHGTGTTGMSAAYKRALNLGMNVVIGHLHTESSIIYHKLPKKPVFGMIVGCGVDEESYGMNYAKNFPKKSITSCGIVLNGEPILRIMPE